MLQRPRLHIGKLEFRVSAVVACEKDLPSGTYLVAILQVHLHPINPGQCRKMPTTLEVTYDTWAW
jgi:hypothetical protein